MLGGQSSAAQPRYAGVCEFEPYAAPWPGTWNSKIITGILVIIITIESPIPKCWKALFDSSGPFTGFLAINTTF